MIYAFFTLLLCLLPFVTAADSPLQRHQSRKRALPRRQENITAHAQRGLVARGAPAGWTIYVASGNDGSGCYVDSAQRTLPDYYAPMGYSSVETGLKMCQEKGYKFAGLENYNEVYCSNNPPTASQNAPSSECSARCSSGELCGAAWRINIYTYTDPSTTQWTLQGCYQDSFFRSLTGYSTYDSQMTAAKCQATCASKGYQMAGLEYGQECYCGNSVSGQKIKDEYCDMKCVGGGDNCGGGWTLSLYQLTPIPAAPAPVTTPSTQWALQGCYQDQSPRILSGYGMYDEGMTIAKCLATCESKGFKMAGLEFGQECYCGNTVTAPRVADQSCKLKCVGGGSGDNCGGSWALSLYQLGGPPALTPVPPSTIPDGWKYVYCASDTGDRALANAQTHMWDLTIPKCLNYCSDLGFTLAGVENEAECYCANSLSTSSGQGKQVSEGDCSTNCAGDNGTKCGGFWRLSLYSTLSGSALSSALTPPVTTTSTTTAATVQPTVVPTTTTTAQPVTPTTTTDVPTPTASPSPPPAPPAQPSSYTIPTNFPSGGGDKQIYAHFIVGNSYPYSVDTWRTDIGRAQAAGLDGFVLNLGPDAWQPSRVADAYYVAAEEGFKMVLSFDMYEFDCGGWDRVPLFQNYLDKYVNHRAAGKYQGRSILTTFAGEHCSFSQGSTNAGWNAVMGAWKTQIYFAPAYNADPMQLGGFDLHAEVNWGSAWPAAGKEIEMSRDKWFMQQLGGRGYIGTVSPLFAAHIPGKNFIWRGDNFLYGARWDQLLSMRDKTDLVEVVSWNDYGESTYINEITGDMPQAVKDQGYATDDFTHSALLSLQAFYSAAWKNGAYPAITQDQIWAMARPHQAWAGANGEVPKGRELTDDKLYIQVHLTAPADVILCSGGCSTQQGQAGINRFSHPLQVSQTASARVERNGQVVARVDGKVGFVSNPAKYNFNYWILSSA